MTIDELFGRDPGEDDEPCDGSDDVDGLEDDDYDEDDDEYDEDEEDEDEGPISWFDYEDRPYAMEIVNGSILAETQEFDDEVERRVLDLTRTTREELLDYLARRNDDEDTSQTDDYVDEDDRFSCLEDLPLSALNQIFGFNTFGMGFSGFEMNDLLSSLGFELTERIDYGAHGHDTNGVIYLDTLNTYHRGL